MNYATHTLQEKGNEKSLEIENPEFGFVKHVTILLKAGNVEQKREITKFKFRIFFFRHVWGLSSWWEQIENIQYFKISKKLLLQSNFAFPENSGKHILSFVSTMTIIIILFSPELSSLIFFFFKKKRKLHIEEKTYAHIPRFLFNLFKSCYTRNIFRKN